MKTEKNISVQQLEDVARKYHMMTMAALMNIGLGKNVTTTRPTYTKPGSYG